MAMCVSKCMQGEGKANAKAYGSATHFKAGASQGTTRTFVGLYNFELRHQGNIVSICWAMYLLHVIVRIDRGDGQRRCGVTVWGCW